MQPATSTLTEFEELSFQEEGVSYTFRELLNMLEDTPDIIITLPDDQVQPLRDGLSARKNRDSYKLNKAGVKADNLVLSYLVYPAKDDEGKEMEGQSHVRIRLAPRKGVIITKIQLPAEL